MTDAVARVNALKSGDVDGGWMLPANAIAELEASGAGKVYFGMNTAVNSLIVSNPEGPLGNPRVRKALLMAIDRDGLVQAAEPATPNEPTADRRIRVGPRGPATKEAAFKGLKHYPYDVEAAARIIKEAGRRGPGNHHHHRADGQ